MIIGNLQVAPGEKVNGYLELPTVPERLPAFLIRGETDGPKVLVLGGIHGCEYTSIDAALKIGRSVQAKDIKGTVIVLPIANPASFYARSIYVHPRDQKNLNRVFPGKVDGTDSERLAYWINELCFKEVDYIIDLHGGDMIESLVPFTIYHITENQQLVEDSKKIASLFDINYVVGSTGQVPGSTYGTAAEQGKVAIIAEAGQNGLLDPTDSHRLQEGTKNVLRSIGILAGDIVESASTHLSRFDWYRASSKGLWYSNIMIGQSVAEGDLLGELVDEFGETMEKIYARTSGVILFLVTSLAINVNDPLLAVGE
jgi:uncharacterized protein